MSSSTSIPAIGFKLRGSENWLQWEDSMTSALASAMLQRYVAGTRVKPISQNKDETTEQFEDRSDAWTAKDNLARLYIFTQCSDHVRTTLTNLKTSREVWDQLKKTYGQQGYAREFSDHEDFLNYRFDGKDLEKFTNEYRRKVNNLANTKVAVTDTFAAYRLVSILGSYAPLEGFYQMQRSLLREKTELTLESVIFAANDEWLARSRTESALNTNTNKPARSHGKANNGGNSNNGSQNGFGTARRAQSK